MNIIIASLSDSWLIEINEPMIKINMLLESVNFEECTELRPFETLKFLSAFLRCTGLDVNRTAESAGLPVMSADVVRIRVTSAQFKKVWYLSRQ